MKRGRFIEYLGNFADENGINIVYSHFFPQVTIMLFQKKYRNIDTFVHIHSDWSKGNHNWKSRLKDIAIYKMISGKTRFISVSRDFVRLNPAKITYVPNGLAFNRIISKTEDPILLRAKYSINDNDYLIEIFGWSPKVKGIDIAVNSVKKLYDEGYSNIKLAIITGGDVDKTVKFIKETTLCSGYEEFLVYIPPIEDVFAYHKMSDLMLSASRSEGFSYSILEALSCGGRVVSSSIPGTSWANDYETVLTFTSENIDECAEAIRRSMTMKNVETDVANIVKETYSIDNWVNGVISCLEAGD